MLMYIQSQSMVRIKVYTADTQGVTINMALVLERKHGNTETRIQHSSFQTPPLSFTLKQVLLILHGNKTESEEGKQLQNKVSKLADF